MCTVKEHVLLSKLDPELIKRYGNSQVIESKYHQCNNGIAIKVLAKVPPLHDRTLLKAEGSVICNLDSKSATFIRVPKHFVKMSTATGSQIVQNFYLPAGCLGEYMEVFVSVDRRVNRNGQVAYVINYYQVPENFRKGRAMKLKIGTPKRYPKEIKRIPLPGEKVITFVDM